MDDVFKRNSSLHQRLTRYSDESKLITPHRKYDYGQNCLSYRGATIWNCLEISIKEAKSCNTFKHLVKARFLRNLKLKEENIYIFWLLFFKCFSSIAFLLLSCSVNCFGVTWRQVEIWFFQLWTEFKQLKHNIFQFCKNRMISIAY